MYEHVVVDHLDAHGTVFVGCDAKTCGNCSGSMFCNVKHKIFPAKNPESFDLQPGDVVELFLPPGKTVFSTFMTLIVPLMLFPAGYYLAGLLVSLPSELTRFFFGIGGVMVGFLIAWLFFRNRKTSYIPTISSIISTGDEIEEKNTGIDVPSSECTKNCDGCPSAKKDGGCSLR